MCTYGAVPPQTNVFVFCLSFSRLRRPRRHSLCHDCAQRVLEEVLLHPPKLALLHFSLFLPLCLTLSLSFLGWSKQPPFLLSALRVDKHSLSKVLTPPFVSPLSAFVNPLFHSFLCSLWPLSALFPPSLALIFPFFLCFFLQEFRKPSTYSLVSRFLRACGFHHRSTHNPPCVSLPWPCLLCLIWLFSLSYFRLNGFGRTFTPTKVHA